MAKIPDFAELTKKLGIDGIVDSVKEGVKSVMGSGSSTEIKIEGDELMAKFAELLVLVQALSRHHAEFGKLVVEVQHKFDSLAKDMKVFRAETVTKTAKEVEKPQKPAKPKAKSTKSTEK